MLHEGGSHKDASGQYGNARSLSQGELARICKSGGRSGIACPSGYFSKASVAIASLKDLMGHSSSSRSSLCLLRQVNRLGSRAVNRFSSDSLRWSRACCLPLLGTWLLDLLGAWLLVLLGTWLLVRDVRYPALSVPEVADDAWGHRCVRPTVAAPHPLSLEYLSLEHRRWRR